MRSGFGPVQSDNDYKVCMVKYKMSSSLLPHAAATTVPFILAIFLTSHTQFRGQVQNSACTDVRNSVYACDIY
jgi:hypothetical protein